MNLKMRNTSFDLSDLRFDWGDDDGIKTPPVSIRHVTSFRQKSDGVISSICPTCDSVAWIACNNEQEISLYQTDGREIKRLALDFYIEDMKLTRLKNLLVSAARETCIKLITTNSGEVTNFVNVFPYTTRGLHISPSREVFMTLQTDTSGRVLQFSPTGEVLRELVLSRGGSPLYGDPDRVTRNSLGDVIVLDWKQKRILSVDTSWRTKFVYDSKENSQIKGRFTPSDVVCDKYDNVLISDCNNNCVHMIDKDGQFLQLIVTEENGISCPCALALDDSGHLWIGQMDGQIHILSYYETNEKNYCK